ncbi:MAG: hypothetical protein R2911_11490 [Caldilineaceae bacterium]
MLQLGNQMGLHLGRERAILMIRMHLAQNWRFFPAILHCASGRRWPQSTIRFAYKTRDNIAPCFNSAYCSRNSATVSTLWLQQFAEFNQVNTFFLCILKWSYIHVRLR